MSESESTRMTDFSLVLNGAYIELTNRCNFLCPYCYNDSSAAKKQYLPLETVKRIISEIAESNFLGVVFSGGEPFLHPDINSIIDYSIEHNVKPTIITNASLITLKQAKTLLRRDITLQLTFDGASSQSHDFIRGSGNFEHLMNILTLANAICSAPKINVRFNVRKSNVKEISSFLEMISETRVGSITFAFLHKSGRGKIYNDIFDYGNDYLFLERTLIELGRIKSNSEKVISYGELDTALGCAYYASGIIKVTPRIDSNGEVFPCQLFSGKRFSFGNVLSTSYNCLTEMLRSEQTYSVVKEIRRRKEMLNDKCSKCAFDQVCMGGCPATAYNLYNDLQINDGVCLFNKYILKERLKSINVNSEYVKTELS